MTARFNPDGVSRRFVAKNLSQGSKRFLAFSGEIRDIFYTSN